MSDSVQTVTALVELCATFAFVTKILFNEVESSKGESCTGIKNFPFLNTKSFAIYFGPPTPNPTFAANCQVTPSSTDSQV